jgi:excisionase family DNA binding protein
MRNLSNRIRLVRLGPTRIKEDRFVSEASASLHELGDRWLSVDEIAIYLGIKRDTVYKWIDRRNLPAHKAGRLWKFRRNEVDDWVRSENTSSEESRRRSRKFHAHGKSHLRGGK